MAIESACIQAAQSGENNEIFRELEINYLAAPKVCVETLSPFIAEHHKTSKRRGKSIPEQDENLIFVCRSLKLDKIGFSRGCV